MSKHQVLVHQLGKIEKHPNADLLGLVKIFGYQICIKLEEFKEGDLVIYIEPDFVCPKNEMFAFLGDHSRIKSRKFRGIYSEGLLIKALPDMKLGDDVIDSLGITRYEPPMDLSFNGDNESGPSGTYPKYDVEPYKKYHTLIVSGEEVIITEKLHGASGRYLWQKDRMWVGSRTNWKRKSDKDPWWQALQQNPWIEAWCIHHEEYCLYGEIFGRVQNLKYGCTNNEIRFAIFDILHKNEWFNYDEAKKLTRGCIWVPEVYRGLWNEEKLQMAEEDSSIKGACHCREGIVIQPLLNRFDPEIGRVKLKVVGNRYLQKD